MRRYILCPTHAGYLYDVAQKLKIRIIAGRLHLSLLFVLKVLRLLFFFWFLSEAHDFQHLINNFTSINISIRVEILNLWLKLKTSILLGIEPSLLSFKEHLCKIKICLEQFEIFAVNICNMLPQ